MTHFLDTHGADDDADGIDVLSRYAPSATTLTADFRSQCPADLADRIVADNDARMPARLLRGHRRLTARRIHPRVPVGASIAVVAAAVAGLLSLLVVSIADRGGTGNPVGGHGPVFDPPPGLSTQALPAGKFAYVVSEFFELDAAGHRVVRSRGDEIVRTYVSTTGVTVDLRQGSQHGCQRGSADGSISSFAKLPTDVTKLQRYLRTHVHGSSSRDEAVFSAVGDMLRNGSLLASPALRASLLAVLSRTPGVYLHRDGRDVLGRPALRVDFVNQRIRPDEVQSLYFAPDTFSMIGERSGTNGQPSRYSGPSPAYTAPAPDGSAPSEIGGPGSVTVVRGERIVDALPAAAASCR